MISWVVVGHQARYAYAAELARSLGATTSMDDGTLGADGNHLRAWASHNDPHATWFGVMEDDAVPVPGFAEQVDAALAVAPAPIVSLYLGRARPTPYQGRISRALAAATRNNANWITTSRVLHAVAILMRPELRDDWIEWAPDNTLPIDERMGHWARTRRHRVAYTTPSLVDHRDGPTLIHSANTVGRVAWCTGTRTTWTPAMVAL